MSMVKEPEWIGNELRGSKYTIQYVLHVRPALQDLRPVRRSGAPKIWVYGCDVPQGGLSEKSVATYTPPNQHGSGEGPF